MVASAHLISLPLRQTNSVSGTFGILTGCGKGYEQYTDSAWNTGTLDRCGAGRVAIARSGANRLRPGPGRATHSGGYVHLFRRGLLLGAALATASLVKVSTARAQEAIKVDAALAEQGAKVWKSKSCDGCHTIGKGKRAGPDLAGVTSRRSEAWLTQWLKNPPEMAKSDPVAKDMVKAAQD